MSCTKVVSNGQEKGSGLKAKFWTNIVSNLRKTFPDRLEFLTVKKAKNKWQQLRVDYQLYCQLFVNRSGAGSHGAKDTTLEELFEKNPRARTWEYEGLPFYEQLDDALRDTMFTGEHAMTVEKLMDQISSDDDEDDDESDEEEEEEEDKDGSSPPDASNDSSFMTPQSGSSILPASTNGDKKKRKNKKRSSNSSVADMRNEAATISNKNARGPEIWRGRKESTAVKAALIHKEGMENCGKEGSFRVANAIDGLSMSMSGNPYMYYNRKLQEKFTHPAYNSLLSDYELSKKLNLYFADLNKVMAFIGRFGTEEVNAKFLKEELDAMGIHDISSSSSIGTERFN